MLNCVYFLSLCQILFYAVLPLCSTYPSGETEALAIPRQFFYNDKNATRIYTYALDEKSKKIYVGGNHKLFKLTYDLKLEETVVYEAADQDDDDCSSDDDCAKECNTKKHKIKLLLIDNLNSALIACGTLNYGLCYKHSLANISNYITVDGPSSDANHILSCRGRSFGLIAPGPGNEDVFYFARTLSNNLAYKDQQSVSTKKWNADQNGFELLANVTDRSFNYQSYVSVNEQYKTSYQINYLYGFSYNGFTYFLTVQPKTLNNNRREMRLARVCQNDTAYYSYSEISLKCSFKSKSYQPIDAQLTQVGRDFIISYDLLSESGNHMLFILTADQGNNKKFALCFYDMTAIEKHFYTGLYECNHGLQTGAGLAYITGVQRFCRTSSSPVPFSVCPNLDQPNSIHHILASKPLTGNVTSIEFSAFKNLNSKVKLSSFHVFINNKQSTIAALGSKTGSISIHHIGANKNRPLVNWLTLEIANQSVNLIQSVDNGKYLYMKDQFTVYKVASSSFCLQLKTCNMCIRYKYLHCGYCASTLSCTSKSDCNESWSDDTCPTVVTAFYPTSGPFEGNTTVVINGEALGHTTPVKDFTAERTVAFGNYSNCSIVGPENYYTLTCLTQPVALKTEKITSDVIISINVAQPPNDIDVEQYSIKGKLTLKSEFSFVRVLVGKFHPVYGPKYGGTQLVIEGKSLDSGSFASVSVVDLPCDIVNRSNTQIICNTTKYVKSPNSTTQGDVLVTIDGTKQKAVGAFSYTSNPSIKSKNIKTLKRYC